MKSGQLNSNYRHGKYCEPQFCKCGKEKDHRSQSCAECSGKGYPKTRAYTISDDQVIEEVAKLKTITDVATSLNISRKRVSHIIKKYNLSVDHMSRGAHRPSSYDDIFSISDKRRNGTVKNFILTHKIIPYVCSCGLGPIWNSEVLTLQLDHKNGNPFDNRLENLRFLCPNCHSQTETFTGKKKSIRKENSDQ